MATRRETKRGEETAPETRGHPSSREQTTIRRGTEPRQNGV